MSGLLQNTSVDGRVFFPQGGRGSPTIGLAMVRAPGILKTHELGTKCFASRFVENRRRSAGSGTIHLRRVPLVLRHGSPGTSNPGRRGPAGSLCPESRAFEVVRELESDPRGI